MGGERERGKTKEDSSPKNNTNKYKQKPENTHQEKKIL